MKKSIILWIIAFILTAATAVFQRLTGPTYPLKGKTVLKDFTVNYSLDRSHSGDDHHLVRIKVKNENVTGILEWKRYKTDDTWRIQRMKFQNGELIGALPPQPPAGKLEYRIILTDDEYQVLIPREKPVVIRFKGYIPDYILIPHVVFIFLAMLFSTRTGLEYFNKDSKYDKLVYLTLIFLILGGFIFGPLVQYFAFGALWTGFPFGYDLTDNKTLIALVAWLTAFVMMKRSSNPHRWIITASVLMFVVFLIPHSLLGSELDYSKPVKNVN
ncbi:hypothetical protein [Ignavibacterium album]|uniref:hypothetical protein n=1 Tax=Ignavibacterium album TaxID=591197 RepID=UPI0035B78021